MLRQAPYPRVMAKIYQMYVRTLKMPQNEKCHEFAYMKYTAAGIIEFAKL
jgi:hypothetical protein